MVTRVGDLPTHQGEVTTEELLLMNATTYALTKVSAQIFRGAGIFTGTGVGTPSIDWLGGTGGHFKSGDMFVQSNGSDTTMWQWDIESGGWRQIADFTPPVFHTEASLLVDTFELSVSSNVLEDIFAAGDFYRNNTLRRLYGPYNEVTGFNFDPLGGVFIFDRSPKMHINIGTGRDTRDWNPSLITDAIEDAYFPMDGDTYFKAMADPDHGGFNYTFTKADYDADVGGHADKLLAGWGLSSFARVPRVFNVGSAPTDVDHNKYITGDYWFDTVNQTLWGPYDGESDESGATALERRDASWGATAAQYRSTKLFSLDISDGSYLPTPDNSLYIDKDILMWNMVRGLQPTTIMFIYDSDNVAWVEKSVVRGPIQWEMLQGDGPFEVFGNISDPFWVSNGSPIEGDIVLQSHTYSTGNQFGETVGGLTGKVSKRLITNVDRTTGSVTSEDVLYANATIVHDKGSAGRWQLDDNVFSAGDYLFDNTGVTYGPYIEGASDDSVAWAIKSSAPTAEIRISQDSTGTPYTLGIDGQGNLYIEEVA